MWLKKKKQIYVYILYFLRFFIYILYLFIAQNRGISPGFPWGTFLREGGVRRLCRSFGRFAQGSAETVHFRGISLLGVVWNFFIFCSGCHYLLYSLVCLLSVYLFIIIIIIWLALIRRIRFCWCEPLLI